MLPESFIDSVSLLFRDEGGYVNDPSDSGGETNLGISSRSYPYEDIKNITYDRARAIYKKDYWDRAKCDILPLEIRYMHFDSAVNMGIRTAVKLLQRASGCEDDGIFGKQTLKASENATLKRYSEERILYYKDIVDQRPRNKKFLRGWINRVQRIINLKTKT